MRYAEHGRHTTESFGVKVTPRPQYLPYLTGVRAIAAYLVLFAHSVDTAFVYGGIPIAHAYVEHLAYLGMSLFFVLSGFVITYTYYDAFTSTPWQRAAWSFAVARFARLYPLYIFFVLGEVHNRSAFVSGTFTEQLSFLTLTQSWWNMQMLTFPPGWSISTEWFFYVCFAAWMLLPMRRDSRGAAFHGVVTCSVVLAVLATAAIVRIDLLPLLRAFAERPSGADPWEWFQYFSPYVRVGEFIAGACAARAFMTAPQDQSLRHHRYLPTVLSVLSLAMIVLLVVGNMVHWWSDIPMLAFLSKNCGYAPFLAYLLFAAGRYPGALSRWCSMPWMQRAGEISYSVYILQFWVFRLHRAFLARTPVDEPTPLLLFDSAAQLIACIVATTIAALVSYRVLELPCRNWIRHRLDPQQLSPTAVRQPA